MSDRKLIETSLVPHVDLVSSIRNIEQEISELEHQKELLEQSISSKQSSLSSLRKKQYASIKIRWVEAVNNCLKNQDGEFILTTSNAIVQCVSYIYAIEADRDVKNKIATTLSILHKKGLLGRIEKTGRGQYLYGDKSLFKEDLNTLKPKYEKMIA